MSITEKIDALYAEVEQLKTSRIELSSLKLLPFLQAHATASIVSKTGFALDFDSKEDLEIAWQLLVDLNFDSFDVVGSHVRLSSNVYIQQDRGSNVYIQQDRGSGAIRGEVITSSKTVDSLTNTIKALQSLNLKISLDPYHVALIQNRNGLQAQIDELLVIKRTLTSTME